MTQEQMYEHIRAQMRQGVEALDAIAKTLTVAGSDTMPFIKGDKHLYVRCDSMPPHSIKTIDFLTNANFLTYRIVAFNRMVDIEDTAEPVATPYIHIYKEMNP